MNAQHSKPSPVQSPRRRGPRTRWLSALILAGAATLAGGVRAGPPADALDLLAQRFAKLEDSCRATENERLRLIQENAQLGERLRICDGGSALLKQLSEQSVLLTQLTERLDARVGSVEATLAGQRPSGGAGASPLADENAQLRASLADTERRLALLIAQFGEAHKQRLAAIAEASTAKEEAAALTARLQQHQQAISEAMFRADKAEKLTAALEEQQARLLTENERLTRELQAARCANGQSSSRSGDPSVRPAALRDVRYRVQANDTLRRISERVYGNPDGWMRIYSANRRLVADPDTLSPGMELVIP